MQFDKGAVQAIFGDKAATLKPTYSAGEKVPEHYVRNNPLAHVFHSVVQASMNPAPSSNPDIERYELVVVDPDFIAANRGVMKRSTTLKGKPILSLELFNEDTRMYSFQSKDYTIEWNGFRLPEVIEEQYTNRANTITITYTILEIAPLDQFDISQYAISPDGAVHVTEVLVKNLPPGSVPAEITIEKPAN